MVGLLTYDRNSLSNRANSMLLKNTFFEQNNRPF